MSPIANVVKLAGLAVVASVMNCGARSDLNVTRAGPIGDASTPNAVPVAGALVVSVGTYHVCGGRIGGAAYCWGEASAGQLGNGRTYPGELVPVRVMGVNNLRDIVAGHEHSCVIQGNGTVMCWGGHEVLIPTLVSGLSDATKLAAGWGFTCAIRSNERVACWSIDGALGFAEQPRDVEGVVDVVDIAAGSHHVCAVRRSGSVTCWGQNNAGAVGAPIIPAMVVAPTTVPNVHDAVRIAAGDTHSCAVRRNGEVVCWGGYGTRFPVLGNGTSSGSLVAEAVPGLTGVESIDAGGSDTCVVTRDAVQCWGGGIINWSIAPDRLRPATILQSDQVVSTAVGCTGDNTTACIVLRDTIRCWGRGSEGQIGNGLQSLAERPVFDIRLP